MQNKGGGQDCKILLFPSTYDEKPNLGTKKPHFFSSSPVRGEEDKKWGFLVNGRGDRILPCALLTRTPNSQQGLSSALIERYRFYFDSFVLGGG